MTEHAGLLQDAHFWVLLATILFVAIAYKKGKAPLLNMLDGRTKRIQTELEEAARLRAEAEALLAETQRKHRDAVQESQVIIDTAKETAARVQKEAQERLSETLKRREVQLLDRISRAEAQAVQELRTQAAEIASKAAETLLKEALAKGDGKLVDEAIRELPGRLN